jgi:hypothetical protein
MDSHKKTIEDMQRLAQQKGGACLSKSYSNCFKKLTWKCRQGHIWDAAPAYIKYKTWCPKCAIEYNTFKHRLGIQAMQQLAKSKGGKCLSKEYIDANTYLEWECKEGHKWIAIPHNIKRGAWCPLCYNLIRPSEEICRRFFEELFGKRFPTSRPSWLKGPKGGQMHIDGYCETLQLGFEYNGKQHYNKTLFFERRKPFEEIAQYDHLKKRLCKENHIIIIDIPFDISYNLMKEYITKQCEKENIDVPFKNKEIDYKRFNIYSRTKIEDMRNIAIQREGKCVSDIYINSRTKIRWQCKEGHEWEAIPANILFGGWCPTCNNKQKGRYRILTITEMHNLAGHNKGLCLSNEYINSKTKLRWQCENGHIFEARPGNVKSGKWCPICRHKQAWITRRTNKEAEKYGSEMHEVQEAGRDKKREGDNAEEWMQGNERRLQDLRDERVQDIREVKENGI